MPFLNFHSGRVNDPKLFDPEEYSYIKLKGSNVEAVIGRLKGEKTTTVQAYRFPTEHFTAEEARKWLKENNIKVFEFAPAKEKKDRSGEYEFEEMEADEFFSKYKIKNEDSATSVNRYDQIASMNWITEPFKRTPEGFLRGRAIVTNVGVFTYKNADGSSHTELRLPEEVFAWDSLETLKLKPVVNTHPNVDITPENINKYQVGNLGDNPGSNTQWNSSLGDITKMTDGLHLAIDMIIQESGAIQDATNGRHGLSCGYKCDLEKAEDGAMWCGVPYDFIQRRIRYNHVALVDKARAGDAARIRLDGNDAILIDNINIKKGGKEMPDNLKKITLDGVEYQAEAPVIAALTKSNSNLDTANKDKIDFEKKCEKLQADYDSLKDKYDKMVEEFKTFKEQEQDPEKKKEKADQLDAEINSRVQSKMVLLEAAKKAGIDCKNKKDADIEKEIILSVYPSAKLDGRDEVYIKARFDSAVEDLMIMDENNARTRSVGGSSIPTGPDPNRRDGEVSAEKSREKMIQRMHDDSRGISDKEDK